MATRIRQKAENRQKNRDNRPYAVAKDVRMSSSKVRIVLDNIRGKKANEAVAILSYMPQKGASESLKVLKSAIAALLIALSSLLATALAKSITPNIIIIKGINILRAKSPYPTNCHIAEVLRQKSFSIAIAFNI